MTSLPPAPELPHGDPRVVSRMFDRIAKRYDLMNRLLSFGIDGGWRRFSARQTRLRAGDKALDIASGTGDLSFELAKSVGHDGIVVGLDIAHEMLVLAVDKGRRRKESHRVDHHEGDAMALPYIDNVFRATTMAFGGRNVPDLTQAFREMNRVMMPGGRAVFLELNRPRMFGFKQLFDFYFHTFSPLIGGIVSGDREAYSYLPRSVDHFESVGDIAECMRNAGMRDVEVYRLMFGVAVVHVGTKPTLARTRDRSTLSQPSPC